MLKDPRPLNFQENPEYGLLTEIPFHLLGNDDTNLSDLLNITLPLDVAVFEARNILANSNDAARKKIAVTFLRNCCVLLVDMEPGSNNLALAIHDIAQKVHEMSNQVASGTPM